MHAYTIHFVLVIVLYFTPNIKFREECNKSPPLLMRPEELAAFKMSITRFTNPFIVYTCQFTSPTLRLSDIGLISKIIHLSDLPHNIQEPFLKGVGIAPASKVNKAVTCVNDKKESCPCPRHGDMWGRLEV
jgi:hypothetical protein